MAVNTGMLDTYMNTEPIKRVVTDRIEMVEPMDIPLVKALGINNGKFSFVNEPGKKYEWLEDTYRPLTDTANDADLAASGGAAITTLTVTHGEYFHIGDIIQMDDELCLVTAISGDDLTIVRGWGNTTGATHAQNETIYIRSQARKDGADASDSPTTEVTANYNYSFILHENVEVARSNALIKRYGIPDLVDREIDKKMQELMRFLTMKPYYGERVEGASGSSRDCGGFDTFITTNKTNASSVRLTRALLEDLNEDIFGYGGTPDLIICNTFQQRMISDMFEGFVVQDISEKYGGVFIEKIQMAIGNIVNVLVDRYCPAASLYMIDSSKAGFIEIDPFFYEELGKTSDTAAYGQVVGEYGFVVTAEKFHGKLYGLATS